MTSPTTTQAQLGFVAPFFIVRDVMASIAFYKDRLGFELTFLGPDDDPDALAEELSARGVEFREPLGVNSDQLRGFEVMDVDGYVLYFGRPV